MLSEKFPFCFKITIKRNLTKLHAARIGNSWEFLHSLGKELQVMMILPLKNIFYSAIAHLILKISQFLQPTTTTFKVTLMESLLINRDHPPLNKNKPSLPLDLFDSQELVSSYDKP